MPRHTGIVVAALTGALTATAGAARSVRGRRAVQTLMMLLTGASAALLLFAQFGPDVVAHDWIWLVIITLTAWPSYWAWCSRDYSAGYADGYLEAIAAQLPETPKEDAVTVQE